MRVIPQRDGRFLLEPLKPKKDVSPLVRPNSRLDQKEAAAPAGQGHHKFEPWTFQELILTRAKGYCGAPYSRGASLAFSRATDCSGFVLYIYDGFKIDLPRSSAEQSQVGQVVTQSMDFSKMLPGDLLFGTLLAKGDMDRSGTTDLLLKGPLGPQPVVWTIDGVRAIDAFRSEGGTVLAALAIVDRKQGGSENIAARDVRFAALFTIDELRSAPAPARTSSG